MTLKQSLPELERISKEIFDKKLSGINVREVIRFYNLEKLKIRIK